MIEKGPQSAGKVFFHDIIDGALLKSHPLFSNKPNALQIVLNEDCSDDIEICNPLGSFALKTSC